MTCKVEGCNKPAHSRGWCRACYGFWWRTKQQPGSNNARYKKGKRSRFVPNIDEDHLRRLKEAYNAPGGGIQTRVRLKHEIAELEKQQKLAEEARWKMASKGSKAGKVESRVS